MKLKLNKRTWTSLLCKPLVAKIYSLLLFGLTLLVKLWLPKILWLALIWNPAKMRPKTLWLTYMRAHRLSIGNKRIHVWIPAELSDNCIHLKNHINLCTFIWIFFWLKFQPYLKHGSWAVSIEFFAHTKFSKFWTNFCCLQLLLWNFNI